MSVTAIHLPFKKEFEPVVRIEENIAIPRGPEKYDFYKVLYVEPIQPITIIMSLSAEAKNVEKLLEVCELKDYEAGQWRLWIPDFISVTMKFPRAVTKWNTKSTGTYAVPLSMAKEQILEFYTIADDVPLLLLTNPLSEEQVVRLIIWGFKYSLKELKEKPKEFTVFPVYSADYVIGGGR